MYFLFFWDFPSANSKKVESIKENVFNWMQSACGVPVGAVDLLATHGNGDLFKVIMHEGYIKEVLKDLNRGNLAKEAANIIKVSNFKERMCKELRVNSDKTAVFLSIRLLRFSNPVIVSSATRGMLMDLTLIPLI